MRQIRFRAWDKTNEKMIYLDKIGHDVFSIMLWHTVCLEGKYLYENDGKTYEFDVEQFTGLLDKNGKEIYEGDIVRCFDKAGDRVCEVEIDFYGFREMIWSRETEGLTKVEVIGNVHENPDLLK